MRTSLTVIFMLLAGLATVAAADEPGTTLTVTVTDAASHVGVPYARVLITGEESRLGYTDDRGVATYRNLTPGSYRGRVGKDGYAPLDIPRLEIAADRSTNVSLALARRISKMIGSVRVQQRAVAAVDTADENAVAVRAAGSLLGGIERLPRVSAGFQGFSPLRGDTSLSVDGGSSRDTGLDVDGIPLAAGGGSSRGIAADLFGGASVGDASRSGALAGGLDFRSLNPTIAWQERAEFSGATFAQSAAILREQGTIGNVGFALSQATRTTADALNGRRYDDVAGTGVYHDTTSTTQGTFSRVRAELGRSHVITGTMISSGYSAPIECAVVEGLLPCSAGAASRITGRTNSVRFNDTTVFGNASLSLTGFVNTGNSLEDELGRAIAGVPYPAASSASYANRGLSTTLSAASGKHSLAFNSYISAVAGTFSATATPVLPAIRQGFASRYARYELSDDVRASSRLHVALTGGSSTSSRLTSGYVIAGARYTPNANDALSLGVRFGLLGTELPPLGAIGDPAATIFDCRDGVALVNATGEPATAPKERAVNLSATHSFAHARLALDLYAKRDRGGVVETVVDGTALGPSFLPPGYLSVAQQIRSTLPGCASQPPLDLAHLFVAKPIGGTVREYTGGRAALALQLGTRATLAPYFDLQGAKVVHGDRRLENPYSVIARGVQLPGIPLHVWGAQATYAPSARFGAGFEFRHVDRNNPRSLPAYGTLDLSAALSSEHHTLSIGVTNLFNTYPARLDTFDGAVPLATAGGLAIPTVAHPLGPRQIAIVYRERVGRVAGIESSQQRLDQPPDAVAFRPLPLPSTPPAHPFEPNVTSASCTPGELRTTQPLLDALSSWIAEITEHKTDTSYPANAPRPLAPGAPVGVGAVYHGLGSTFAADVLLPSDQRVVNAFLHCATLHFATAQRLSELHAYLPVDLAAGKLYIAFQPALGLYFLVPQPGQPRAALIFPPLPRVPPAEPLGRRDDALCTSELKPLATHLLQTLAAYVAAYRPGKPAPPTPDGWNVTPHDIGESYWLALSLTDEVPVAPIARCAMVHEGTRDDIRAHGLDAGNDLNFSPTLGLYRVKP